MARCTGMSYALTTCLHQHVRIPRGVAHRHSVPLQLSQQSVPLTQRLGLGLGSGLGLGLGSGLGLGPGLGLELVLGPGSGLWSGPRARARVMVRDSAVPPRPWRSRRTP
eukprot:scaffold27316_cov63-Phaeocystis_antarctica.AAC.2